MAVYHTKIVQKSVHEKVDNILSAKSQENDLSIFSKAFLEKHKESNVYIDDLYSHHNNYIIVPWSQPTKEWGIASLLVLFHGAAAFFFFNYIFIGRFIFPFLLSFSALVLMCVYLYHRRNLNRRYVVFDRNQQLIHIIGLRKKHIETIKWKDADFLLFESHLYQMVTRHPIKFGLVETADLYLLKPGSNGNQLFSNFIKSWPDQKHTIRLSIFDSMERYQDREDSENQGILLKHHLFYKLLAEFMSGNSKLITDRELIDCLDCLENMGGDYQGFIRKYKPSLLKIPFDDLPEQPNWQRDSQGIWKQKSTAQWHLVFKFSLPDNTIQPPELFERIAKDYPQSLTPEQDQVRTKILTVDPDFLAFIEDQNRDHDSGMRKINILMACVAIGPIIIAYFIGDITFGFKLSLFFIYLIHVPWAMLLISAYIKEYMFNKESSS